MDKMDPINPWIDPGETRRMAERLMLPAREPVVIPEEAGFDDSFVGFSGTPAEAQDDAVRADGKDAGKREDEKASPVVDEQADSTAAAAPPDDPEVARRWDRLRGRFDGAAFFLCDANGKMACAAGGHEGLHPIARDYARAGAAHPVRLRVRSNAVLELVPIRLDAGNLCLGIVVSAPLKPDEITEIRQIWATG